MVKMPRKVTNTFVFYIDMSDKLKKLIQIIKQGFEAYRFYIPMISFFLPMDQFFLLGGIACIFIVLDFKTFKKSILFRNNWVLYIFTVLMTFLAWTNQNTLGLIGAFFLWLVTIYTTYLRTRLTRQRFETMSIILGLGSIVSLYYATVDFYTTSTYQLYLFFMRYIHLDFDFITGIAEGVRSSSTYINPNFYAHISAFIALLALYQILVRMQNAFKDSFIQIPLIFFYGLVIAVNLIALTLSASRSSLIGLVIGTLFLLWALNRKGFLIGFLFLSIFLIQDNQWLLQNFLRLDVIELAAEVRIDLYLAAIQEIRLNPFFGKGLYTLPLVIENYGLSYQIHSHNLFLEAFLSSGFVGTLLLSYHFIAPLFKPFHLWIKSDHPYVPLVIGIAALEVATGFTDAVIVFPQTFLLISLVFFSVEVDYETL
jgi:O-antigen ligase